MSSENIDSSKLHNNLENDLHEENVIQQISDEKPSNSNENELETEGSIAEKDEDKGELISNENSDENILCKQLNDEVTKQMKEAELEALDIDKKSIDSDLQLCENAGGEANIDVDRVKSDIIDSEQILNEFTTQKSKVSLPPKLNDTEILTDSKLVRMHRETISQDLGSIVKNVHGILSSVGGSLKNAYRTSPQNIVSINKFITNGNIKTGDKNNDASSKVEIQKENSTPEGWDGEQVLTLEISDDKFESFKKRINEQEHEILILRERVKQQNDQLLEKDRCMKENENKVEIYRKKAENAEREMNSAVMKYATSERIILEARAEAEKARKSEKAANNEMNLINTKLKSAYAEKQRICQLYDDKCHELSQSDKEVSKLKEELLQVDNKLKWTQGRLKSELDTYKDSASQIEKLTQQISQLEAERNSNVAQAQEAQKCKQLENDLTECQAALIMSKHEASQAQARLVKLSTDLEHNTEILAEKTSKIHHLETEIDRLATSNMCLEQEAAELAALRARAALADTLATNLERESARVSTLEAEVSSERSRAASAAARESRALQQATELLDKHSSVAAELSDVNNKAKALIADNATLRERLMLLDSELTKCREAVCEESNARRTECQLLARKVAELTAELEQCQKQLEWEKGEIGVLKKKHASALKELSRELHRAMKRCEHLEAKMARNDSQDLSSARTGSVTSLSSTEAAPPLQSNSDKSETSVAVNGHQRNGDCMEEGGQIREPDKQTLIERIVQLQRAGARRSERIDFLEEHNRQLTGELRKKAKLLKHLTANLPTGAMAQQCIDDNKKEMARLGGGAMAALWGGQTDGLTLELSIEMNRKLQSVLEDTLLKNITLKENMETLGAEIERLKATSRSQTSNS